MINQFSKDQVLDRIAFENPWWKTTCIDPFYSEMNQREYFHLLFPLVLDRSIKRAVVLMGPRRVGKTVLLYHCIQELINTGVNPNDICYLSIENPFYNRIPLEELLKLFVKINSHDSSKKIYIFFDEIQYLKDWEVHLKSLVDSYHNIKFIVSGSAAAALKLKSQESGAGRFTEFILPPLTFHEYLSLTGNKGVIDHEKFNAINDEASFYIAKDINKLNELFIEYINYGGYPELSLSEAIQSDPGRYIRNDIIDKVLMRDLPSLYGISDIQELNSLFTYLAYNSGNELSLDGISQNSGVAKNTIKRYITYLEAAFLIKVIHRVDQSGKKFKRANFFKIYLTNPSLRSALFSPISANDELIGNMVETAIFSQWQHSQNLSLYYGRWSTGEVDMVAIEKSGEIAWGVEIKWSNRFVSNPYELKSLKHFCGKNKLDSTMITTIDLYDNKVIDGVEYVFVPASIYCYTVGINLIQNKKLKKRKENVDNMM